MEITKLVINWVSEDITKTNVAVGQIQFFNCINCNFTLKYNVTRDSYWVSFGNTRKDNKSGKYFDGCWLESAHNKPVTDAILKAYAEKANLNIETTPRVTMADEIHANQESLNKPAKKPAKQPTKMESLPF